jgi:hypothetical protein
VAIVLNRHNSNNLHTILTLTTSTGERNLMAYRPSNKHKSETKCVL